MSKCPPEGAVCGRKPSKSKLNIREKEDKRGKIKNEGKLKLDVRIDTLK